MQINWIKAAIATLIGAMLAWWLWQMGTDTTRSWLLCGVGGGLTWIGLLCGMSLNFERERSGMQARIAMTVMATIVFGASCIYSFFEFSPVGYVVPVGVFAMLCLLTAYKLYETKE